MAFSEQGRQFENSAASKDLSREIAQNQLKQSRADIHGFHDMSERELVDWLGQGHAQPGSVAYKHAELVLGLKQREAVNGERTQLDLDEAMEQVKRMFEPKTTKEPAPASDRLSSAHLAVLSMPFAVFGAGFLATRSVGWSVAAAAVWIGALFFNRPRRALVRLLGRITDQ
jgi:hypothetical protein